MAFASPELKAASHALQAAVTSLFASAARAEPMLATKKIGMRTRVDKRMLSSLRQEQNAPTGYQPICLVACASTGFGVFRHLTRWRSAQDCTVITGDGAAIFRHASGLGLEG